MVELIDGSIYLQFLCYFIENVLIIISFPLVGRKIWELFNHYLHIANFDAHRTTDHSFNFNIFCFCQLNLLFLKYYYYDLYFDNSLICFYLSHLVWLNESVHALSDSSFVGYTNSKLEVFLLRLWQLNSTHGEIYLFLNS